MLFLQWPDSPQHQLSKWLPAGHLPLRDVGAVQGCVGWIAWGTQCSYTQIEITHTHTHTHTVLSTDSAQTRTPWRPVGRKASQSTQHRGSRGPREGRAVHLGEGVWGWARRSGLGPSSAHVGLEASPSWEEGAENLTGHPLGVCCTSASRWELPAKRRDSFRLTSPIVQNTVLQICCPAEP